jgi:hypothetical protein
VSELGACVGNTTSVTQCGQTSWGKFAEEFKLICMTFEVISAVSILVNKFLDKTSRDLLEDDGSFGRLAT